MPQAALMLSAGGRYGLYHWINEQAGTNTYQLMRLQDYLHKKFLIDELQKELKEWTKKQRDKHVKIQARLKSGELNQLSAQLEVDEVNDLIVNPPLLDPTGRRARYELEEWAYDSLVTLTKPLHDKDYDEPADRGPACAKCRRSDPIRGADAPRLFPVIAAIHEMIAARDKHGKDGKKK